MMRARGKAARISPTLMKFSGILSTTRCASEDKAPNRSRYSSAIPEMRPAPACVLEPGRLVRGERGLPERQLAGSKYRRMGSEDLLRERGARSRHADDEDRPFGAGSVGLEAADRGCIETLDHPIDPFGDSRAVVLDPIAPDELVGQPVAREGFLVVLEVVEVFAARIAQADLVPQRQRPREQGLGAREPGGIRTRHLAIRRDAVIRERKARIDLDGAPEQLLGFGELAAVGAQFPEERQGRDRLRGRPSTQRGSSLRPRRRVPACAAPRRGPRAPRALRGSSASARR